MELNPTIAREFNHLKFTPLITMRIDKGENSRRKKQVDTE